MVAKNPLLNFFKHIPDKVSPARAAKAFDLEIEDFLTWAEGHSIKFHLDLEHGLPIIGEGNEIEVCQHFYEQHQEDEQLSLEKLAFEQSRSEIRLHQTNDDYEKIYEAQGRWMISPYLAIAFRLSDTIELNELCADFSMMCGVELEQPIKVNINELNITLLDLEKIANHLIKPIEPLPSHFNEGLKRPNQRKPRKQREEPIYRTAVYQLASLISAGKQFKSIAEEHGYYANILAKADETFAIGLDTFARWHPKSKSIKKTLTK